MVKIVMPVIKIDLKIKERHDCKVGFINVNLMNCLRKDCVFVHELSL